MKNKFERIVENLEERETLTIGDQTFLNEIIFDESIQCSIFGTITFFEVDFKSCLLYTSPSPRDLSTSRMPSSA